MGGTRGERQRAAHRILRNLDSSICPQVRSVRFWRQSREYLPPHFFFYRHRRHHTFIHQSQHAASTLPPISATVAHTTPAADGNIATIAHGEDGECLPQHGRELFQSNNRL